MIDRNRFRGAKRFSRFLPVFLLAGMFCGGVAFAASPTVDFVQGDPDNLTTNGHYDIGETIYIEVVFDQVITFQAAPAATLQLNMGPIQTAAYYGGADQYFGATNIVFSYTIQGGDFSPDLAYSGTSALQWNGPPPPTNAAGELAIRNLPVPGTANSLSDMNDISVGTASLNLTGADDTVLVGDTITWRVTRDTTVGTATIDLYSPNTSIATVPAMVDIISGQTSTDFLVTGVGVGGPINIAASNTSYLSDTKGVEVIGKELLFQPPSGADDHIDEGSTDNLWRMWRSDPSLTMTVVFTNSNIGVIAPITTVASFTAGSYESSPFSITAIDDSFPGPAVTITAYPNQSGYGNPTQLITVDNVDPFPTGFITPTNGMTVGLPASFWFNANDFAGTNDTDDIWGEWDFGDGTPIVTIARTTVLSRAYSDIGDYTALLTVYDGDGGQFFRSFGIAVDEGYLLTVDVLGGPYLGTGQGTYILTPTNVSTVPGVFRYQEGQHVSITALPVQPDNYFYEWGGDVPEALTDTHTVGPRCPTNLTVTMDDDRRITLLFSHEHDAADGDGDLDWDRLPDVWEVAWGLDPKDQVDPNGTYDNADGDFLPGIHTNGYPYPEVPIDMELGYSPDPQHGFHNWFEYSGFDQINGTADDANLDPLDPDTDEDGLLDGWEYYFWANARSDSNMVGRAYDDTNITNSIVITAAQIISAIDPLSGGQADGDPDGDGLLNFEEMTLGTDPIDWDTDNDGMPDGWEVLRELDPLNHLDGETNPDNDHMAATTDDVLIHYHVYLSPLGYDPRTGWGQVYSDAAGNHSQINTRPYTSLDEFRVSQYLYDRGLIGPIEPENWAISTTDPLSLDTDADGIIDGWELYVDLSPVNAMDAGLEMDNDGLSNIQEYRAYDVQTAYPDDFPVNDAAWLNKFWPTDPHNNDTDGDQLADGAEGGAFKYAGGQRTGEYISPGGGLNPCSCDTEWDAIPDYWEVSYAGSAGLGEPRNGMDGTAVDSTGLDNDYDSDGLENYQEYWVNAVYHFQYFAPEPGYPFWQPGQGVGGYDPADFFIGTPLYWDPVLQPYEIGPDYVYQIAMPRPPPTLAFASTSPNQWDTDMDAMDDYYEMYHGLNPLYGSLDVVAGVPAGIPSGSDIRVSPYLAGHQAADPDQDGLTNDKESIIPNIENPQRYHTDPSPLWVTDHSYSLSWVNQYYWLGSQTFYWEPITHPVPSYAFSFESNEGFDTDNDNIPDHRELVGIDYPGFTDPFDDEHPLKRRALKLDGASAARTRGHFYHSIREYETFTVEAWVRPDVAASGTDQVVIEKSIDVPNNNPMGWLPGVRLNFRLGIDATGHPYVKYHGAGYDPTVVEPTIVAPGVLHDDEWVHLAGVYDADDGKLKLYVDGVQVAAIPSGLIPFTGWFEGQIGYVLRGTVVIGAEDLNPSGYVSKSPILVGPAAGLYPGGSMAPNEPILGRFFDGWIDEVRIWNGPRDATEIQAAMPMRMKRADVIASYAAATSDPTAPVLTDLYNFDDLPDPDYDPVAPEGFIWLNGRPDDGSYPAIPWWQSAAHRSLVYTDPFYIPWIANAASDAPRDPPYDSQFWQNVILDTNGLPVATNEFPNASNPYFFQYTRYPIGLVPPGDHFDYNNGQRETTGAITPLYYRIYNSLLPLMHAEADEDVEMWDGGGTGLEGYDSDGDGLPDWWEERFGTDPLSTNGVDGAGGDADEDGLINYYEFLAHTDPNSADSDGDLTSDADEDYDQDGLSNGDEFFVFGSDAGDPDTDDDGYIDGDEVLGNLPLSDDYGFAGTMSSPTESIAPHVRRSYVANGRDIEVPHSERFAFTDIDEVVLPGPTVDITAPLDGAQIAVRFTDLAATITPVNDPIESVLLYINDRFVADYGAVETVSDTIIINSGENIITVYGIDTAGLVGSASVTIEGTFARADIRVTQTWSSPGDLDTWLLDPQDRHMGWTMGGPGLPTSVAEQIPGAFLDIDDIPGTGPENITLEETYAIAGEYKVWMNNYSHSGNPDSTVRILVNEGRPGESYVEFGPQAMPTPDYNGTNPDAWWHVTTITMPEGTMDPPGAPVLPPDTIDAPDTGNTAESGWTIEGWVKPGDASQSGAIARYETLAGYDAFVVGLDANQPFVQIRASGGTVYEAKGGAIDAGKWTHLAFVYSSSDQTVRLHINGLLAAGTMMVESRDDDQGTLYFDTTFSTGPAAFAFTDMLLDEFRVWKVARNGGLIAGQMHVIQRPIDTLVANYRFDDGGTDIEDARYPINDDYDLGQGAIPDVDRNAKPGPDGDRYTLDDIAFSAASGPDGENDFVTSMEYAPVMGIIDADEDGIADWFEDLTTSTNMLDGLVPTEDLDGDGLLNLFEFLSLTNPHDDDTDGDGTIDPEEDFDGDDVANLDEQINGTDPWLLDTDDDGVNDGDEIEFNSSPTNALMPAVMRSLYLQGSPTSYVEMTPAINLALSDWTISAKVYLETPVTAGSVIAREVQSGQYTYLLGIGADRIPYVLYTDGDGTDEQLFAPALRALPVNVWVTLSASFSSITGDLRLMIDGDEVAHMGTEGRPKTFGLGPVRTTAGAGISGYMDDVEIVNGAGSTLLLYSFDDGTHVDGVSAEVDLRRGQVQNLASLSSLDSNWAVEWRDAGTLVNATISLYPQMNADDTDGDGLPDAWEIANGLSPYDSDTDGDGTPDGSEDGDLDGLTNLTEYRAGTDPDDPNSDGDSTLDKDEDADADGLTNMEEQSHGSRPDLPDTDDDGVGDYDEIKGPTYTLPTASLSPAVARALILTAGTQSVELPDEPRFRLVDAWTVEAWVYLDNLTTAGNVISRSVGSSVNYQLGIEADGTPYARSVGTYDGVDYEYKASDAVPIARAEDWYHLAAVWSEASGDLQLYVNGELRAIDAMPNVPGIFSATGAVQNVIGGSGFVGQIDEARIWRVARTADQLAGVAHDVVDASEVDLVGYYRFDDGTHAAGTSGTNIWPHGQVEDFAVSSGNWEESWTNAATLVGGATVSEVSTPIPASAFVDTDIDELPDFWEMVFFGALDAAAPAADADMDGLFNLFEYRAKMHPGLASTFEDGKMDGDRDPDDDGLINSEEVLKGTLPCEADTDDDGLTDREELAVVDDPSTTMVPDRRSNPRRSMDPPRPRSLSLDGASRAVVPPEDSHSLAAWTVEAWVRADAGADGIVMRRATSDLPGNMRGINYELGVENRAGVLYAYAQYVADLTNGAALVRLDGSQPEEILPENPLPGPIVAAGDWTHLAATYEPTNMLFRLYVDGNMVSYRIDAVGPAALGAGEGMAVGSEFTVGGGSMLAGVVQDGFLGHVDEVRVISGALSEEEIENHAAGIGQFYGLVHTVDSSGTPGVQALPPEVAVTRPHVADEIMVRFKTGVSSTVTSNILAASGTVVMRKHTIVPVTHLKVTDGAELKNKLAELQANPNVLYAEPNYILTATALPDDSLLDQLWGLHNEGQNGGVEDADIDAPEAWDRSTGSDGIIVAVIDTGVNYNHVDLADNMWTNPNEIPGNDVDDDGNGYVDDVYGYDFANDDGDPLDDHDHGTHCAGTIGGVGNNGEGVVGVNWKVRIMALKFLSGDGGGTTAGAVSSLEYAVQMGAQLSNNSYGGGGYSQAMYDTIEMARNAGHLFVAAAGNESSDNDSVPAYPASYDLDNIISVAATDRSDGLAGFSNYGLTTVDIGAPGVDIHSTLSGGGYGTMSGTSMASPHTAGAAALVMAVNSQLTYDQVRKLILDNADPIESLDGMVDTGARLNVFNALPEDGGGDGGTNGALGGTIVAYLTFDDDGDHAEDFTVANDHLVGWRRSARLEGTAAFDDTVAFGNQIDSDGDGMPDWWEIAMGMDPYSALEDDGPDADTDMDGLTALYEYWANTDPRVDDTDVDGRDDGEEDADKDTLSNRSEQDLYGTNPAEKDTDDDGEDDPDELAAGMSPVNSLSAYVPRAMDFSGITIEGGNVVTATDKIDGKYTGRLNLPVWTVECLVKPDALGTETYPLISRRDPITNFRNYEIGLQNGYPYVAFDSAVYGGTNMIVGASRLPVGDWTHICGRFTEDNMLTLYVDGGEAAAIQVTSECALGIGDVVLGSPGFDGQLMMARIWRIAQDEGLINELRVHNLFFGNASALAGLLRVNGNGFLKESAYTEGPDGLIDELTGDWTLEAWIKTESDGIVVARRNGATVDDQNGYNYKLAVVGGVLQAEVMWTVAYDENDDDGNVAPPQNLRQTLVTEEIVADGVWHHVAFVRRVTSFGAIETGHFRLYIDGLLHALDGFEPDDRDPTQIVNALALHVLTGPIVVGEDLIGDIDEVRIWNVAHDDILDIRNYGWRNLVGDEEGLITYFNFDYQINDYADERAAVRDPLQEFGVYINEAQLIRALSDTPIIYDPLLTLQDVALVAYFSGHDGGDTVEDFIHRMGRTPFDFEKFAGVRGSGVGVVELNGLLWPEAPDSDADSLLDSWEVRYGLHPGASEGDDGPYGDPDHDGLINLYEQLAFNEYGVALSPHMFSTPTNTALSDYYLVAGGNSLTFGEIYDDTDVLPDIWEMERTSIMDRHSYHRDDDEDGDEWDNQDEYLADTNPEDGASAPNQGISGRILYSGIVDRPAESYFHVLAYDSASMDTEPIPAIVSEVEQVVTFSFENGLPGREVYLLAYKSFDQAANEAFKPGDSYGVLGPVFVGINGLQDVEIGIRDQEEMPWFHTFSWTRPTDTDDVFVQLIDMDAGGELILTRWINLDRSWNEDAPGGWPTAWQRADDVVFHMADYGMGTPVGGGTYERGLPPGNYKWQVASNDVPAPGVVFAEGQFAVPYVAPPDVTLVWPVGGTKVRHQIETFKWTVGGVTNTPRFTIAFQPVDGAWEWWSNIAAPVRDADGVYSVDMPLPTMDDPLFGESVWTNGMYSWKVRSNNEVVPSAFSATGVFELAIEPAPPVGQGASSIEGSVIYHGKANTSNILVQAYRTSDYRARPQGQDSSLTDSGPFAINGLRDAEYTVIAFIDANTNGLPDEFEPQGYARDPSFGSHYQYRGDAYAIRLFNLSTVDRLTGADILIRDRDTDDDDLPDGWEWDNLHNSPKSLAHFGTGEDMDGDQLSNLDEYGLNSDPTNADTDGDGLSDGEEVHTYGSAPTSSDSDGDTLGDGYEVALNLHPNNPDDDGDGVPTRIEVTWGGSVGTYSSGFDMNPGSPDTDGDSVGDLMEIASGSSPIDPGEADEVAITGVEIDAEGHVVIQWTVYRNDESVDVRYTVEQGSGFEEWSTVGTLTGDGDWDVPVEVIDTTPADSLRIYRLRLSID